MAIPHCKGGWEVAAECLGKTLSLMVCIWQCAHNPIREPRLGHGIWHGHSTPWDVRPQGVELVDLAPELEGRPPGRVLSPRTGLEQTDLPRRPQTLTSPTTANHSYKEGTQGSEYRKGGKGAECRQVPSTLEHTCWGCQGCNRSTAWKPLNTIAAITVDPVSSCCPEAGWSG